MLAPPHPPTDPAALAWSNRFRQLGPAFYIALPSQPLRAPHWVARSDDCAQRLGLPADWCQREDWQALQVFSGNALWPGMQPLASVYSGHQFGVWAGLLGDGRALWLGELDTPDGPLNCSSRVAASRPTLVWATGARCCARRSANACAPRRFMRWAFPPPAPCA